MPTSPRKRAESIVLALLAIGTVLPLRMFVESRAWFVAEIITLLLLTAVVLFRNQLAMLLRRGNSEPNRPPNFWPAAFTAMVAITPVVFAFLARWFGSPIAFEMSALTTFGAIALSLALIAKTSRMLAMSLVSSGYLVLFSTSISDDPRAVILAIVWMTVCVWHLVANHWETLEVCMPDQVRQNITIRPASVLVALALCIGGGLLARDRFATPRKLSVGFIPTSGGSKWSDPAARSGIGTGDAAIAAKDHAESFGAVESEIFLESEDSTLFDMVNDLVGEPKKRKFKWERRQAMGNDNVIPMHEKAAKSEKGVGSFSTDRMPPKKHRHFEDKIGKAVVQWDGPTGIRLGMHRYDTFDGVNWTNTADHARDQLVRQDVDDHHWFFDPAFRKRALSNSESVSVNLLKVLRLDSTRLPTPMMSAGLHVKDVDRADFFGIEADSSMFMPGRDKIPPLTVFNIASLNVLEDELITGVQVKSREQANSIDFPFQISGATPYEQLRCIIDQLRSEFTLDRGYVTQSEDPIAEFMRARRGGDFLFASAAALLARQIGLSSRMVAGFYVRPEAYDLAAGHADVLPDDVHFWTEVQLEDGRWFELEPTPGYREPVYTPSLWLSTKRLARDYWRHGLIAMAIGVLIYLTRLIVIDRLLAFGWSFSRWLRPSRQLQIAMSIVETRARLIGKQRPKGVPQRDWLETLVARDVLLQDRVTQFCDAADRATFGGSTQVDRRNLSSIVRGLNAKKLKETTMEATS